MHFKNTLLWLPLLFFAKSAHAQTAPPGYTLWEGMRDAIVPIGRVFGYPSGIPSDIRVIAFVVVSIFLRLLAVIFIILIIYGGYIYLTSQGIEEKVQKGKAIVRTGIIGAAIIIASLSIATFVLRAFVCAVSTYSDFCFFLYGID